jgi:hypothetical protein
LSRLLGVEPVRIEHQHDFGAAPVDLSFRGMPVPAGSVARLTRRNLGYASADATTPFVTAEVNWMVGRSEMVPAGMNPDHHYVASIEGTPSLSMGDRRQGIERERPATDGSRRPKLRPGVLGHNRHRAAGGPARMRGATRDPRAGRAGAPLAARLS